MSRKAYLPGVEDPYSLNGTPPPPPPPRLSPWRVAIVSAAAALIAVALYRTYGWTGSVAALVFSYAWGRACLPWCLRGGRPRNSPDAIHQRGPAA